jgi:hypothetical protein
VLQYCYVPTDSWLELHSTTVSHTFRATARVHPLALCTPLRKGVCYVEGDEDEEGDMAMIHCKSLSRSWNCSLCDARSAFAGSCVCIVSFGLLYTDAVLNVKYIYHIALYPAIGENENRRGERMKRGVCRVAFEIWESVSVGVGNGNA